MYNVVIAGGAVVAVLVSVILVVMVILVVVCCAHPARSKRTSPVELNLYSTATAEEM